MKIFISCVIAYVCMCCNSSISGSQNGNCEKYYDKNLKTWVFTKTEVMPQFSKGEITFLKLFAQKFVYPTQEYFQGKIVLELIINKKGVVIEKNIYKKSNLEYTEVEKEALRVLDELPRWIPGKCNNIIVVSKIYYPINFSR
ncbi:MAG: hypothetical protein SFY32_05700 [Bacteroidota bacterium]|nr:hypothetical protein [Bacteroidota bacterium]